MSENTSEIEKEKKEKKTTKKTVKSEKTKTTTKKTTTSKPTTKKSTKKDAVGKKETKKVEDKKFKPVENKSVQNKVIENIKSFITKIIEMQEKVKQNEKEEKEQKKVEEAEKLEQENAPKYLLEYYDLPYRYNETIVKILAQTPKRLFVYWDISDKDKQTYLNAFGEYFFNDTYPVLLVHNENKNYTYEVIINDFANSWYLDISDPRDNYTIQLGRKFKSYIKPQINPEIEENNICLNNDYLFIAMSNKIEVPNDRILFDEFKPYVKYRNVKTYVEEIKNVEKTIYKHQIKELYKELYNEENIVLDENGKYDMLNPSSMGTSSSIAK